MSDTNVASTATAAPTTPAAAAPASDLNGVEGTTGTASTAKTAKTSETAKKAATPASGGADKDKDAAAPSLLESVKRFIPGLGSSGAAAAPAPKKRNRNKKPATGSKLTGAEDPALATATLESAPDKSELPESLTVGGTTTGGPKRPAALNGGSNSLSLTQEEQSALEHKRFSAAAVVQKRLKANNKKLQRVTQYEDQVEALNPDQKKAVAGKGALEAVQRELNELTKVFETEEAEDEKKAERKKQSEEKQVQIRINQAVSNANIHTQNDLTLLLQFLHLYSCFSPSQSFAPPSLPPVVANATAQQHAAVHTLFHNLANGPLFGGSSSTSASNGDSGDAVSQIKSLQDGSNTDIIEGVSFADIKQMILDLTAPPAEIGGHEIPESEAGASHINDDSSKQPPLAGSVDNANNGTSSLNFLQASEIAGGEAVLTPPTAADDAQHEKALEGHSALPTNLGFGSAVPNSGIQTPLVTTPGANAPTTFVGGDSAPLTEGNLPASTDNGWLDAPATGEIKSWADEVEDANPSNPYTATAEVPTELTTPQQTAVSATQDDGFTENRGGRGGRGGRGRGRGGDGARGDYRGRGRGRSDGQMQWRRSDAPNADAANSAIFAAESAGEVVPGAPGTIENEQRRTGGNGQGGRGRGRGGPFRGGNGEYRGAPRPRGGDGSQGSYRGRGGQRGPRPEGNTGSAPVTPTA